MQSTFVFISLHCDTNDTANVLSLYRIVNTKNRVKISENQSEASTIPSDFPRLKVDILMITNFWGYFSQKTFGGFKKSSDVCDAKTSLLKACTYYSRHKASFFPGVIFFGGGVLANFWKGLASFVL